MDNSQQIVEQVKDLVTEDLILGNPLLAWVRAAIIIAIVLVGVSGIRLFARRLRKKHLEAHQDDISVKLIILSNLGMLNYLVAVFIAQYFAIMSLAVSARAYRISKYLFIIAVFMQILIWANNTLNLYGQKYIQRNPSSITAMSVFSLMWKVAAFTLIFLVMLDQLGFNITALLAGLGVGGIAIAFALQNVLSDVFGSLAIIFDKPFKVGDTIQIGTFIGRVEKVGLKTTRVRSLRGEQLVFSNNELLKSTVQNFGDLQERRISQVIGVTYETSHDKLKKVPEIIKEAIFSQPNTSLDHITLKQFADSSLNFEVQYYIRIAEEAPWLQIEHNINLEIIRLFEKEGISFAYPTRTVYTKNL